MVLLMQVRINGGDKYNKTLDNKTLDNKTLVDYNEKQEGGS